MGSSHDSVCSIKRVASLPFWMNGDFKGKAIVEWTSIEYAWRDGPVIDTLQFQYAQVEYKRRRLAVAQIRKRILLLSRPPLELQNRKPQTYFFWLETILS
ncbi:unnamed protein product [Albugo candida]|uniref:Uncharacterized protein n=1 Tax=Albugo candida TaxID=65357 RepID=A0A024G555_9STRA|nr:unnamed protein product [Albugo candida]|eukprot:CCI41989.1 unnamed protein product [Albugo candida]